ncbi:trypsin domain-containing protein [Ditylenchus destructor]|nr:trypsin domain-containing protein [Ditylenchus destructor]
MSFSDPSFDPNSIDKSNILIHYGGVCIRVDSSAGCELQDTQTVGMKKVLMGKEFTESRCRSGNDVAIVELERKINLGGDVQAICLLNVSTHVIGSAGSQASKVKNFIDMGWGRYEKDHSSAKLRFLKATPLGVSGNMLVSTGLKDGLDPGIRRGICIDTQTVGMKKVLLGKEFTDSRCTSGNDVAIVELERKVNLGGDVQAICLLNVSTDDIDLAGSQASNVKNFIDMGWGRYEKDHSSAKLRFLKATPLGVSGNMLVSTGFKEGDKSGIRRGICLGDSGGPTQATGLDERAYLMGIHSSGPPCNEPAPDGYGTYFSTFIPLMLDDICALYMLARWENKKFSHFFKQTGFREQNRKFMNKIFDNLFDW